MSIETRLQVDVVSFQEDGYHVFTEGKVGGHPVRLLIDTGASRSVLDRKFLTEHFPELKLEANDQPATGAGSNSIQSEIAESPEIILGKGKKSSINMRGYLVAVLDLSHVNETYAKINQPPIQGVIGSDLLVQFSAVINFKKKRMKLRFP